MVIGRRSVLSLAVALPVATMARRARAEGRVVRLGFAYTSAVQAIVKDRGFVEAALAPLGATVQWTPSFTSSRTFEYLRGSSVDFGGAGGSAALQARASGNPVQLVYYLGHGDIMALTTLPSSGIKSPADLKGKRVAAAPGTEPYYFLLRGLQSAGLTERDIKLLPLAHPDGRLALQSGNVDAWAGLDPEMSKAELEAGAVLFWHKPEILTGSVLVVREAFAQENPDLLIAVLRAHEQARRWALDHPDEASALVAKGAGLTLEQSRRAFARIDLTRPAVQPDDIARIGAFEDLLKANRDIPRDTDVAATLKQLVAPQYLERAVAKS